MRKREGLKREGLKREGLKREGLMLQQYDYWPGSIELVHTLYCIV